MKNPSANLDNFLKIGDAAKTLGVSIDTLRRWEKAGKITPIYTPGGTRLYSLELLQQIKGGSKQSTGNSQQVVEGVTEVENNRHAELVSASQKEIPDQVRNDTISSQATPSNNHSSSEPQPTSHTPSSHLPTPTSEPITISEPIIPSHFSHSSFTPTPNSTLTPPRNPDPLARTTIILEPDSPTPFTLPTQNISNHNTENISALSQAFRSIANTIGVRLPQAATAVSLVGVVLTTLIASSYLKFPEPTKQFFASAVIPANAGIQEESGSPIESGMTIVASFLSPFNSLAKQIIETTAPGTYAELALDQDNPTLINSIALSNISEDITIDYLGSGLSGDVLAEEATAHYLQINSDTQITGALEVAGQLVASSSATIASTLNVGGATTITGETTLEDTLLVSGATTLESDLTVSGNTTMADLVSSGQIKVTGNIADRILIQPSSDPDAGTKLVTIKNAAGDEKASLTAGGSLVLAGDGSITGALTVSGASSLSTLTTSGLSTLNSLKVTGTTNLVGAATLDSTLKVSGASTLSSTLEVSGATTLASTLAVSGATTIASTLGVTGATTLSSTLAVTGAATFASTINTNTFTATALTFSGSDPIIGASTAGTSLTINPGTGGNLFLNMLGGNVGIGVSDPNSKLAISGNVGIGSSFASFTAPNNGLAVEGNVGIGTTTANANLAISGNAIIGSNYLGYSPPPNGLIVEGSAGIGTSAPQGVFDVNGASYFRGNLSVLTGQLFINDGTNYAPGLTFVDDSDSGLYRIGSNHISLTTGGSLTNGLNINSNGNVGLGTTAANSKLVVVGGAVIGSDLSSLSSPTNGLYVQGNTGVGTTATGNSIFNVGGNAIIGSSWVSSQTAPSNGLLVQGNVGIGATFTNTYTLSVGGNIGVSGHILPTGSSLDLGSSGQRWNVGYFNEVNATTIAGVITGGSTNAADWTINADNATADTETASLTFERGTLSPNAVLRWETGSKLFNLNSGLLIGSTSMDSQITDSPNGLVFSNIMNDLSTQNNEHLSLIPDGTGNVGINTTNPYAKLTVRGAGVSTGLSFLTTSSTGTQNFAITDVGNVGIGTTTPTGQLQINGSNGNSIFYGNIIEFTRNSANYIQASNASGSVEIVTGGAITSATRRLTVLPTGNIGIAQIAPTGLFQVGNAVTPGLFVASSTGNVGIGTTGVGAGLQVANNGTFGFGSTSSITGPSNGLAVAGNLGVGTTTANYNLSVIGTGNFTGQLTLDDGLASSPALSFTNDTNTGIFRPSADALGFSTGGSSRMTITASGNVGIGTTTPEYKLHITSGEIALDNNQFIRMKDAGGTYRGVLGYNNSGIVQLSSGSSGGAISFTTAIERMRIDSAGNVGIGTSTTSAQLHVQAPDGANTSTMRIQQGSSQTTGNLLEFVSRSGTTTAYFGAVASSYNTHQFNFNTNNTNGLNLTSSGIQGGTNTTIAWGSGGLTTINGITMDTGIGRNAAGVLEVNNGTLGTIRDLQVRALNPYSGNVGVGTTSASAFLEINTSSAGEALRITRGATGRYLTILPAQSTGNSVTFRVSDGSTTTNALYLPTTAANQGELWVTGNVGIGTTGPTANLEIKGTSGNAGNLIIGGGNTAITAIGQEFSSLEFKSADTSISSTNNIAGRIVSISEASNGANSGLAFYTFTQTGNALTEKLRITNDGNIGIGNSDPDQKLQLQVSSGRVLTHFRSGTADAYIGMDSSLDLEIRSEDSHDIVFKGNSSAELARILTSGNVGINNSAPSYKLDIGTTGDIMRLGNGAVNPVLARSSTSGGLVVKADGNISDSLSVFQVDTTAGGAGAFVVTDIGNVGIGFTSPTADLHVVNSGSGLSFRVDDATNDTTPFVINTVGNAGIGTDSPEQALDVLGSAVQFRSADTVSTLYLRREDTSISGTNSLGIISFTGDDASTTNVAGAAIHGVNDGTWASGDTPGRLSFWTTLDGTETLFERMRIDNAGNVGIGNSGTLASRLVVAGGTSIGIGYGGVTAPSNGLLVEGNVGIGNSAPSYKLDVIGNGRFSSDLVVGGNLTVSGNQTIVGTTTYTGQILGADGSASAPQYSFSSDDDSGLWRIGTNQIALTTGGSAFSGLSINSSGNVGIGYTNAVTQLDVRGDKTVTFPNPGTGSTAYGTIHLNPTSGTNGNSVGISFGANNSGTVLNSAQAGIYAQSSGAYGTRLYFTTSNSFGSGAQSRLMIGESGNIGIGTTTPESLLTLANSSANPTLIITPLTSDTADPVIELHGQTAITNEGFRLTYDNSVGDTYFDNIFNGTDTDPAIRFRTETGATAINALTILHNGNIGIGTASPLSLLDVLQTSSTPNSGMTFSLSGAGRANIWLNSTSNTLNISRNSSADIGLAINSSGNVGIGTTNPASILEIQKDQNTNTYIRLSNASTGNSARMGIEFYNDTAAQIGYFGAHGSQTAAGIGFANTLVAQSVNSAGIAMISSNASGIFRVFTGGTASGFERMRIDANGNMGIGTAAPVSKLGVAGNVGIGVSFAGSVMPINGLGIQGNVGIGTSTANSKLAVTGGMTLGINYGGFTAPTNGALIQGNVGIGTTGGVDYNLVVNGSTNITGALMAGSITTAGSFTPSGQILASDGTVSLPGYSFSSDTNTGLFRPGTDALGFSTGASSRMSITAGGFVGIGNTNPTAILTVQGTRGAILSKTASSASTGGISIQGTVDTDNSFLRGGLLHNAIWDETNNVWDVAAIGANDTQALLIENNSGFNFITHSSTANASRTFTHAEFMAGSKLQIHSSGNVGIGITTAGTKLAVNGNAMVGFGSATSISGPSNGLAVSGNIGIGTSTANSVLSVASGNIALESNNTYLNGENTSGTAINLIGVNNGNLVSLANGVFRIDPTATAPSFSLNSSGQVQILDGSHSTPAYSFLNDTDTGLWRNAANIVALTTAGSSSLQANTSITGLSINSAGNVGIGTTSQGRRLHIHDINTSGTAFITGITNSAARELSTVYDYDNNVWRFRTTNVSSPIAFNHTGTEALRIATDGNIGIGTTGPGQKFAVSGGYSDLNGLRIGGQDSSNTIYKSTGNLLITSEISSGYVGLGDATNGAGLIVNNGNTGIGYLGGIPGAKLAVNGNVGIGTSNATTSTLQVYKSTTGDVISWGNDTARGALYASTSGGGSVTLRAIDNVPVNLSIASNNPALTVSTTSQRIGINNVTSPAAQFQIQGAGVSTGLTFLTHGLNGGGGMVGILDNGNVGIGTSAPSAKFHIAGSSTGGTQVKVLSGSSTAYPYITLGRTADEASLAVSAGSGQWANNSVAGDLVLRTELTTQKLFINNGTSATGIVVNNNNVGIGNSAPSYTLDVIGTGRFSSNLVGESTLGASSYVAFGSNYLAPVSTRAVDITYTNLNSASSTTGLNIDVRSTTNAKSVFAGIDINITNSTVGAAIATAHGIRVNNPTATGAITSFSGLTIAQNTTATNNSGIVIGQLSLPTGNYGIFNSSTYNNYFAGNVGIGISGSQAVLNIYEPDESTTLTNLTQAISDAGILISTNYTASAFTPGVFWNTTDNTSSRPKAGIFLKEDSNGTDMYFGTSNNYATGITNTSMVINEDGNLGIGTTGPSEKLHVSQPAGTSDRSGYFTMTGGTNGTEYIVSQFDVSGSGAQRPAIALTSNGTVGLKLTHLGSAFTGAFIDHNYSSATGLYFGLRGHTYMRLDNTGNLGIGTTVPTELLHLSSTSDADSSLLIENGSNGASARAMIQLGPNAGGGNLFATSTGYTLSGAVRPDALVLEANSNLSGGLVLTANASNGVISFATGTNNPERMRLDANGNLGVGTTAPNTLLQIYNSATTQSGTTPNENLRLQGKYNGVATVGSGAFMRFTNQHSSGSNPNTGEYNLAGVGAFDYDSNWGGALVFYTSPGGVTGGANLQQRMLIKPDGNVGIGTTLPTSALNVEGRSTELPFYVHNNTAGNFNATFLNDFVGGVRIGGGHTGIPFQVINGSSTPLVSVNSSGNLGIGISNPGSKLHILGTAGYGAETGPLIIADATAISQKLIMGYDTSIDAAFISSLQSGVGWENLVLNAGGASAGNVGINTVSPTAKLHILGMGTSTAETLLTQNSTKTNFGLAVQDDGNVGIGTTAPGARLTVGNTGNSNPNSDFIQVGGLQNSSTPTVMLDLTRGRNVGSAWFGGGAGLLLSDYGTNGVNSATTRLDFALRHEEGVAYTGINPQLSIQSGGNIGIGTTNPSVKLEVSGTTPTIKIVDGTTYDTRLSAGVGGFGIVGTYTNQPMAIFANSAEVGRFGTDGGLSLYAGVAAPSEGIIAAGNVGIGTSTPSSKLHIISGNSGSSTPLNVQNYSFGNSLFAVISDASEHGQARIYNNAGSPFIALRASGDSWLHGGNVGIGNSAPTQKLHLTTADTTTGALRIEGALNATAKGSEIHLDEYGTTVGMRLAYDSAINNFYIRGSDSSNFGFSQRRTNGNVGIGNTDASALFHVGTGGTPGVAGSDDAYIQNDLEVDGVLNVAGAATFGSTITPTGQILGSDGTAALPGYSFSGDTNSGLWRIGADHLALTTAGDFDNGIAINSAGFVGIGISTPQSQIHVRGGQGAGWVSAALFDTGSNGDNSGTVMQLGPGISTGGTATNSFGGRIYAGRWSTSDRGMRLVGLSATGTELSMIHMNGISGSSNVLFGTAGAWAGGFDNGGNLGIGTTSPAVDFHIVGDAASTAALLLTQNSTKSNIGLAVMDNGNVGIGTSASTARLLVTQTEGSAAFDISAGDATISDGSLYITDDDNAGSFRVTNNTANTIGVGVDNDGVVDLSTTSITTGNFVNIESTTSLTSGRLMNMTSTATAFTGDMLRIALSGSNANNTGNLLDLENSGTLSVNTAFYLKHYATGTNNLAMRVDDVSGDTTPLVIDGGGNLGIGVSSPVTTVQVARDLDATSTIASLMGNDGIQFSITGSGAATLVEKLVLGIDTTDNYGIIQAGNTAGTAYNLAIQPGGGNVGIGTTSPSALFEVVSGGVSRAKVDSSGRLTLATSGTSAGIGIGTSNANGVIVTDSSTEAERYGSARRGYKVTLVPEFEGATFTAPIGIGTSGTMTSDFCVNTVGGFTNTNTSACPNSSDIHNYYEWVSTDTNTNAYDLWVRWQVPSDFGAWDTSQSNGFIQANAFRTNSNGSVKVSVYDTAGAEQGTAGGEEVGDAGDWNATSDKTVLSSTTGTWTAGGFVTFRIRLSSNATTVYTRIGELELYYLSKFK